MKSQWIGSFIAGLTLLCAVGAWSGEDEKVKVKTLTSVDKARQGSAFHVAVVLDVSTGWHTYDNNIPKPYVATELKLTRFPHSAYKSCQRILYCPRWGRDFLRGRIRSRLNPSL